MADELDAGTPDDVPSAAPYPAPAPTVGGVPVEQGQRGTGQPQQDLGVRIGGQALGQRLVLPVLRRPVDPVQMLAQQPPPHLADVAHGCQSGSTVCAGRASGPALRGR